jgi:hypothetical protein
VLVQRTVEVFQKILLPLARHDGRPRDLGFSASPDRDQDQFSTIVAHDDPSLKAGLPIQRIRTVLTPITISIIDVLLDGPVRSVRPRTARLLAGANAKLLWRAALKTPSKWLLWDQSVPTPNRRHQLAAQLASTISDFCSAVQTRKLAPSIAVPDSAPRNATESERGAITVFIDNSGYAPGDGRLVEVSCRVAFLDDVQYLSHK